LVGRLVGDVGADFEEDVGRQSVDGGAGTGAGGVNATVLPAA
jgi:hypothetical protein